jgi:hypothetical protein
MKAGLSMALIAYGGMDGCQRHRRT